MKTQPVLLLAASTGLALVSGLGAQTFPLSENSWSNPEFRERFLGSYGFDTAVTPRISSEEQEVLQKMASVVQRDRLEAIRMIEEALTADSSAALDYILGNLYLEGGEIETAVGHYETALRKFPNFFRAYQNLGLAHVQAGRFEEAAPFLTKALEIGGGNGTLYGLLGYCYLQMGEASAALDAYRQAILFMPQSRDWKLGKLEALLQTGQDAEALTLLGELLAANPGEARFWLKQANTFLGRQAYLEAAANLALVRELGEASGPSLVLLGDLLLNEGLPELAASVYENAVATGELSADRLLRAAEALANHGATAEARIFLADLEAAYGTAWSESQELEAISLQARLALAAGEKARAAELLQQVVARDPLNGKALLTLGHYYRDEGEPERAQLQYERAAEVEETQVNALIALGRLKVNERDYRAALTYLRRAHALDPREYLTDYIDQLEAAARSLGS